MLFQSIWGNTVFQILSQWCVQHWTLSDLLEQIRDEYSEYPVSVYIKDSAQQVWHCCSTHGFLLGRQRMKTFEHGMVQMLYYCHWVCQSMRFWWGNSNTEMCIGKRNRLRWCSDFPSDYTTTKWFHQQRKREGKDEKLFWVWYLNGAFVPSAGSACWGQIWGCSSLATADKVCSWIWRVFVLLFICFSLRVCPGKSSWQSHEQSSWQKLD